MCGNEKFNFYYRTASLLSGSGGNPVILEALLKAGANPNARSMMGHTALQYAMTRGHSLRKVLKLVGLLLQYGAVADTHGNFSHHSRIAYALKSQKLMDLLGFSMEECAERDRQEQEEKAKKRELIRARLRERKRLAAEQSGKTPSPSNHDEGEKQMPG